jgi:hypothetical protein
MTAYELFETAATALAVAAAAGYAFARLRRAATTPARTEQRSCSAGCDDCIGCSRPAVQRSFFVARPPQSPPGDRRDRPLSSGQ